MWVKKRVSIAENFDVDPTERRVGSTAGLLNRLRELREALQIAQLPRAR
jgi:hypothetical protein